MSAFITMPKVGHVMEEGTIVAWRKAIDDKIERGDVVLEIEMDKANFEVEAFETGTLAEILAEPGDVVKVGTPIARLSRPIS